jgi:hypothetical protein
MKSFLEYYTEAKQVGVLYHYTKFERLFDIIKQNQLTGTDKVPYVSFTRDKNFHAKGQHGSRLGIVVNECRFVIDGDKLSHRYKLEPYDYFGGDEPGSNEVDTSTGDVTHKGSWDEQEERTLKPINDIKNYIIKIKLLKRSLDAYENNLGAFSFAINHENIFKTFRSANQYIKFLEQFCPVEVVEKL